MKIKFTKLLTTVGTIRVSLDGGNSFNDYNIADIHESGVPLSYGHSQSFYFTRFYFLQQLPTASRISDGGTKRGVTGITSYAWYPR